MCGILGLFNIQNEQSMRSEALKMVRKIRHRGPDWSGSYSDENCVLMHERLSIVDVEHGAQPLYDTKTDRVLAVNGEIYNHKELSKKLTKNHDWQTYSDCEVLLYLYDEFGTEFLNDLDGIFAFCLYDPKTKDYFIARDHIGIVPLYIGWDKNGVTYVTSEMKTIEPYCEKLQEFPPGHYYINGEFTKWYKPKWVNEIPTESVSLPKLRKALEDSVHKQLMCDVPYGVLISGGLDSSVIAAIAAQYSKKRIESGDKHTVRHIAHELFMHRIFQCFPQFWQGYRFCWDFIYPFGLIPFSKFTIYIIMPWWKFL
jgi:asparagine synthase (glutamine-hydrolysing)